MRIEHGHERLTLRFERSPNQRAMAIVQNHRSVIAELTLADGERWRLGYELIWLQPSASSEIPGLIKRLRKATGPAGDHTE
jgi:hypothetical protein